MEATTVIIYLACLIAIFIIGKIFYIPLKYIFRLLLNSILGGILIYIVNVFGASFGFHIGLNVATAIFCRYIGNSAELWF